MAAASCGRFSSASEPSPVSTSAEDLDQIVPLGLGEGGNRGLLGVEADAGATLVPSCVPLGVRCASPMGTDEFTVARLTLSHRG